MFDTCGPVSVRWVLRFRRFFWRNTMRLMATDNSTATATPTPMPALAPVERLCECPDVAAKAGLDIPVAVTIPERDRANADDSYCFIIDEGKTGAEAGVNEAKSLGCHKTSIFGRTPINALVCVVAWRTYWPFTVDVHQRKTLDCVSCCQSLQSQ
jgi:hypothetical protein